jgi:hypothetical protein
LARAQHAVLIWHQWNIDIRRIEQHVVADRNELLHDFLLRDECTFIEASACAHAVTPN